MTRTLIAAGLAVAGLTATATAQTITPGIGGVAITGQSGAGIYLPWSGGAVAGAPGVGNYSLSGGGYTAPWSWNNYSNPTAYNFNTGSFNYNSGLYESGFYGSPWGGVYQSGYTSPYSGNNFYGGSYYGGYSTPYLYTNSRGRLRWR